MYKAEAKNINFYYGDYLALKNVSLAFGDKTVTALIGPSGCGKSTFLRLFNRMNDLIDHVKIEGEVLVNGQDVYSKEIIIDQLRKSVGMVFQKPNPFPKTVFENVLTGYGLTGYGIKTLSKRWS
jgi:phosphate transport system ATP-binding protein